MTQLLRRTIALRPTRVDTDVMDFTTTLDRSGGNTTGFVVPADVVEALDSGKRPRVVVTVNDHTWRTTVAVYGGVFMVGVSAANRAAAGIDGDDTIDVRLELDTAPRVVEVPDDLARALAESPRAKAFYESLSYSNQRRHVLAIEDAKTPETRQRRITKAVTGFEAGTK